MIQNALVSQRKSRMICHLDAQKTLAGYAPRQRNKIANKQSEVALSQAVVHGNTYFYFLHCAFPTTYMFYFANQKRNRYTHYYMENR